MLIELFYFDGCPSWQEALENLKAALVIERLQQKFGWCAWKMTESARLKFLGHPPFGRWRGSMA